VTIAATVNGTMKPRRWYRSRSKQQRRDASHREAGRHVGGDEVPVRGPNIGLNSTFSTVTAVGFPAESVNPWGVFIHVRRRDPERAQQWVSRIGGPSGKWVMG
jgi:hypothetical protein